ncbi:DUF1643 domain-containing protein [Sneathiella glossodoripedis]|uniref:DUF1643 domain-containing protein n=1 Tax=Sneathiella glossodoripedis TaxID=418853 RepID=UPI000471A777|nr:DUF1643 domain-containing protein [Sneathiella glossodoripedis]
MDAQYFGESDALFSECNAYRYKLWRRWADGPSVAFLMLNPSTADATRNDPTVERCHRRAVEMGFGALEVINIFAFRATDPKDLKKAKHPIGPLNDEILLETARKANMTVCAWGSHGVHQERDMQVRKLLKDAKITPHILALTKFDQPRHPLYVSYSTKPIPWTEM